MNSTNGSRRGRQQRGARSERCEQRVRVSARATFGAPRGRCCAAVRHSSLPRTAAGHSAERSAPRRARPIGLQGLLSSSCTPLFSSAPMPRAITVVPQRRGAAAQQKMQRASSSRTSNCCSSRYATRCRCARPFALRDWSHCRSHNCLSPLLPHSPSAGRLRRGLGALRLRRCGARRRYDDDEAGADRRVRRRRLPHPR